jgi:hypothetical protein
MGSWMGRGECSATICGDSSWGYGTNLILCVDMIGAKSTSSWGDGGIS